GSRQLLDNAAIIPNLAATDPVATLQSLWQFTCQSDTVTDKLLGIAGTLIVIEGEVTKRIFEGARYFIIASTATFPLAGQFIGAANPSVPAAGSSAPTAGGAALGYGGSILGGISVGYGFASGIDDFLDFTDSILFSM